MPFLSDILLMLLSLPVVLLALSVHESAHGYAAYRLGDPTAHSLGRITLNPVKHFDLFGFLSMLVFHIGWAKPVPINARYFKNPRRDFAIVGAAGPLSNICLALIHLLVLRLAMIFAVSNPPIVEMMNATRPRQMMSRVCRFRKFSATAVAPTLKPRKMVTVFINPFCAVLDKRPVTPQTLRRLPSIKQPINTSALGTIKPTITVTTMGKMIFSAMDTLRVGAILILRSFSVVKSLIKGG